MTTRTRTQMAERLSSFTGAWPVIVESMSHAFRMTAEERSRFEAKTVARLIGAIPFLAGCDNPERTAVAHLGTYLLSVRETKPFFHPSAKDDEHILARLRLGMSFQGGDSAIIDKGMAILALNMLNDYVRDIQIDAAMGKHNPVASGAFHADHIGDELMRTIESVSCPEMDTVLSWGDDILGAWGV